MNDKQKIELLKTELNECKEKIEDLKNSMSDFQNYFDIFTKYAADPLFIYNLEKMHLEFISPSIEKVTGFAVKEALDKNLIDFMTKESYENIAQINLERKTKLLNGKIDNELFIDELVHFKKDGSTYYSESTHVYAKKKDGTPIIVGILRNVDEKKKMQLSLIKTHNKLKDEHNKLETAKKKLDKDLEYSYLNLALNNNLVLETFFKIKQNLIASDQKVKYDLNNIIKDYKKKSIELNWEKLIKRFDESSNFFNKIIIKHHPDLTKTELRYCHLLRLNLTVNDISMITLKSYESVKKAKSRLRKKLGLVPKLKLSDYLNSLV